MSLSTSHKTQSLVDFAKDISDLSLANDQDEIQQFPSADNEQPKAVISRKPLMGISFVDEAIVSDVQTDEYETDDSDEEDTSFQMSSQSTEGISRCLAGRVIRAVVRLINARGLSSSQTCDIMTNKYNT